jgi:large subunit ribosomal protein L29
VNIEEVRSKTDSELEFDVEAMKKELFEKRFRGATETSADPARIRVVRRSIARIQTVLHERQKGIRGQEPR